MALLTQITVVVFEENMLKNRRNTEMKFLECPVAHWRKSEKKPLHLDRYACLLHVLPAIVDPFHKWLLIITSSSFASTEISITNRNFTLLINSKEFYSQMRLVRLL